MRILLPLFLVLFAGCQTKPSPERPAPLPVAEAIPLTHARLSAEIGHYTLGAYVDPDNDLIRHEAHAIQRIEREPRWDLSPAPWPLRENPDPAIAVTPDPIATPAVVAEAPVHVTESEPSLVLPPTIPPRPSALATVVAPPPATPPPAPPVSAPTTVFTATVPSAPILTLNAESLLDLTAVADRHDPNPFSVRNTGTESTRELSLQLAGVIAGAEPCALVNGRPLQAGDTFDSFLIVRVEQDAVLLRHEEQLIRLPVSAKPARLRVAL